MKKVIFVICSLLIISCTSELNENNNETNNYAKLIKNNSHKIINSNLLEKHFNPNTFVKSSNKSTQLITQEQLDEYLKILDVPEEYKNSLNIVEVNQLMSKLADYHNSGDIEQAIVNTNLSIEAKESVLTLVEDRSVQDVREKVEFDRLAKKEKETLLVVNDLTNDHFSNMTNEVSDFKSFSSKRLCNGSGPRGSGQIDCRIGFAIIGAAIGSVGGGPGAIIGGIIGFIYGNAISLK